MKGRGQRFGGAWSELSRFLRRVTTMTLSTLDHSSRSPNRAVAGLRRVAHRLRWLPWLGPIAVLVLSLGAWHETRRQYEVGVRTEFDFETEQMCDQIMARLHEFGMILRGGKGLFDASSHVSRDAFRAFATSMDPQVSEPGLQGLGFATMVPEAEISAHEAAVRSEEFPDYAVHPLTRRDLYSSILYQERFDWRNRLSYGYDMLSDAVQREAMLRARDTASLAASGRVNLAQEAGTGVEPGFLLYLPVYGNQSVPLTVAERRRGLSGFLYGAIRVDDFIRQAWGDKGEIALRIMDADAAGGEVEMFSSDAPELQVAHAAKPFATRSLKVNAFGHPWVFTFTSRPVFDRKAGEHDAALLLIGGTVIALLGWGVLLSQRSVRRRAESLRAAMEQARSASRAKSDFLAAMSHELRTPLNGVIGMAELLRGSGLNARQQRFADACFASGRMLRKLIDDVLDLSKVEAGLLELDEVPLSIRGVVGDAVALVNRRAREGGLQLTVDVAPQVPEALRGDPVRLQQILVNLLGNAIKFTAEGGVRVSVDVEPAKDGGVVVRFEVSDTGIGISADQIGRLFRPFVQADRSTTRRFGGSGLGLSISRSFIEAMGGDIGVKSTPGRGSTFWFTAPFKAAETCSVVATPPALVSVSGRYRGRVLVAEDHPTNQLYMREVLNQMGVDTVMVENGQEVIDTLRGVGAGEPRFDLVLMDCQMPVMDGMEATGCLRAMQASGELTDTVFAGPVVALTANAIAGDRERCIASGMDDYLSKPVEPAALVEVLDRYLVAVDPADMPRVETKPPVPVSEGPPMDTASALDGCMGDAAFLDALLTSFVKATSGSVDEMNRGLADCDTDVTMRAAHALKGAAGMVRANTLREQAEWLETLVDDGDFVAAMDQMAQLCDEAARCVAYIEVFRETSPVGN